jgi:6-pyruvoyltetrahydropterin/6-carboxytetrahydropterin synthase
MLIVAEVIESSRKLPSGAKRKPSELDHNYLNEIEGLKNPTSENLWGWIRGIKRQLPLLSKVLCGRLVLAVIYEGED